MQILIVEDDIMLADLLEESLQSFGHEVCGIASHVEDGISQIQRHRPQMVILDMHLSGELGSDVVAQLPSSDMGDMGVLYITGLAECVHETVHVGHAVLRKPYSLGTLLIAINTVMTIVTGGVVDQTLPLGLQLLSTFRKNPSSKPRMLAAPGGLALCTA